MTETPTFSVKDFEKFQHYKDRAPPWIKLYNELLDSYNFAQLPDHARFHLLAIMLLASRSGNKIPYDPAWVGCRINSTVEVDLDILLSLGFIVSDQQLRLPEQVASTTLAKRLSREREEGEERRGETEKKDGASAPIVNLFPKPNAPPSEEKSYYDRAKEILGPKGNGLAAKLLHHKKRVIAEARAIVELASTKSDPTAYIGAVIRSKPGADLPATWVYGDDFG